MELQTVIPYKDYSSIEIPRSSFDTSRYIEIIKDIQAILLLQPDVELGNCLIQLLELKERITEEKKALDYMKNQLIQTNEQFQRHKKQLIDNNFDQLIKDLNSADQQFEIKFNSYFEMEQALEKYLDFLEYLLLDEKEKELEELGKESYHNALPQDIKIYSSEVESDEFFTFLIDGQLPEPDIDFPEIKCIAGDKSIDTTK